MDLLTLFMAVKLAPKPLKADVIEGVANWLDNHPEATTTVEDGSITEAKLASALKAKINNISGLTDDIKQALLECFAHVAWTDAHGQEYLDALEDALYPSGPTPAELVSISAVYTQSGTVYTTDSLDDLKSDLVVTAIYTDSTTETVTTYTLSGTLTEGTSVITVSYGGKTTTFNVTVTTPATLSSITAVYTQSGTVYDTDSLDSLKADLVVTAVYSDSTTQTVASTDYTLSGTLTEGTSTITVSYSGKTTTFSVTVTEYAPPDTSAVIKSTDMGYGTSGTETALTGASTTEPMYVGQEYTQTETSTNAVCKYFFPVDSNVSMTASKAKAPRFNNDTYLNYSSLTFVDAADSSATEKSFNIPRQAGSFNKIAFTLASAHIDDSYAYMNDTGYIIFAGRNTQYYGKQYITD